MIVDRAANELYVADGYVNHRVIVFDADTGNYKRHWGAYGKRPDDDYFKQSGEKLPSPFAALSRTRTSPASTTRPPRRRRSSASCTRCGFHRRPRLRLRSHQRPHSGVPEGRDVREGSVVAKETFGSGSVWDIGFTTDPDQTFLIVPDGTNQRV